MQTVNCGQCGKAYKAGPEMAGKRLRCKACGGVVAVPMMAAATPTAAVSAGPPPIPAARRPILLDQAMVVPVADPSEVDFDALSSLEAGGVAEPTEPMAFAALAPTRSTVVVPGRRAGNAAFAGGGRTPPPSRFGFRLNGLSIGGIVAGVLLSVYGAHEAVFASGASDVPKPLTCQAVIDGGYKSNAHVEMTRYQALPFFVKEFKKTDPNDWTTVWVPVVTPDVAWKPTFRGSRRTPDQLLAGVSDKIHVVVKTHQVHTDADFRTYLSQTSVDGLVVNRIESLTDKQKELLKEKYVNMDVANVIILEEGRKPAGGKGLAALGGGVLLILVGLAALFRPAS